MFTVVYRLSGASMDMRRAIPDACLWIIPNGRHIPIFDQPEAFAQTALAFLRGDWKGQP